LQKKGKDEKDFDEKNEKDDEKETPAGSKVIKIKISSLRFDTVSKPGFGKNREYTSNFILVDNICAYITLFCNL